MSDGIKYINNELLIDISGNTIFRISSDNVSASNYNIKIGNFLPCKTIYDDITLSKYEYKILADTTQKNILIDFPAALDNLGKQYIINVISGSNNIFVNTVPAITSSGTVYVYSDGLNWLSTQG